MATLTVATTPRVNRITGIVIGAAMKVHSHLGPGLLESAYEACLAHELGKQGLSVARQTGLPVIYDGERIDLGYRIDLIVEDVVVVEVKCVERINPVHRAQLLSYIRLSGRSVGLLINFHVAASSRWDHSDGGWKRLGKITPTPLTTEGTEKHRGIRGPRALGFYAGPGRDDSEPDFRDASIKPFHHRGH